MKKSVDFLRRKSRIYLLIDEELDNDYCEFQR